MKLILFWKICPKYFYIKKDNSQVSEKQFKAFYLETTVVTYLTDRNMYETILWSLSFPQKLEH